MEENFKIEIVSPEKIVFSGETTIVTIPSYEGYMSILKNHISIITFLRPGIITVKKNDQNFEKFFAQDGTVEFFNNSLIVLSTTAINLKDLSKEFIDNLNQDIQNKLAEKNITDQERYFLNHKFDTLKQITV